MITNYSDVYLHQYKVKNKSFTTSGNFFGVIYERDTFGKSFVWNILQCTWTKSFSRVHGLYEFVDDDNETQSNIVL